MSHHENVAQARANLLKDLFGDEVPRLWCPPLTHYSAQGTLDRERMAAHWSSMRPNVRAFLVPGSTGDGWEMTDDEVTELLDFTIELAVKLDAILLIGVLKADVSSMCETISETMELLKQKTAVGDSTQVLRQSRVCGFAVCPPRGAELSQDQIQAGLEAVLSLGLPTALYQLPQVTENEMSPAVVTRLAERYSNFILLKDTSGNDQIALHDRGHSGVFLVRGAEGNYATWLQETGGPYHGLLLSTANCFSAQLKGIIALLEDERAEEAQESATRLMHVVDAVFGLISNLPMGNPFTNANKAMDHYCAYGSEAGRMPPPMLHAGMRLPKDVTQEVGEILSKEKIVSPKGYLYV